MIYLPCFRRRQLFAGIAIFGMLFAPLVSSAEETRDAVLQRLLEQVAGLGIQLADLRSTVTAQSDGAVTCAAEPSRRPGDPKPADPGENAVTDSSNAAAETAKSLRNLTVEEKKRFLLDRAELIKEINATKLELQGKAQARKRNLMNAIRSNPERALHIIARDQGRANIQATSVNCAEQEKTLTGSLQVTHFDNFDAPEKSETVYTLVTPESREITLHAANGIKGFVESRTEVRVRGYQIDDELVFDGTVGIGQGGQEGGIDILSQPTNPPVTGPQKTLVILLGFADRPFTGSAAPVAPVMTQVDNYYREISNGKISLDVDVVGPFQSPKTAAGNDLETGLAEADPTVFLPQYERIVTWTTSSCNGFGGYGTIGKRNLSSQDGPVNASLSWICSWNSGTVGHELGHNFGNHHASSNSCTTPGIQENLYAGCIRNEYGDPYDIMGTSRNMGAFNAVHRAIPVWLRADQIKTITQSGTYTIEPLETASGGTKALAYTRPDGHTIYFEYRRSPVSGALIHATHPSDAGGTRTYLLRGDPPAFQDWFTAGKSIYDYAAKVTVRALSETPNAMTLSFAFGSPTGGDTNPPSVSITSPTPNAALSGTVTVTASASDTGPNASGVQRVEFWREGQSAPFATDTTSPYSGSLNTAGLSGTHTLYAKAFDNAGNSATSALVPVQVLTPDTQPPTISLTAPQNNATVQGSAVTLSANANDDVAVQKVEFLIDGNVVLTDTTAPYSVAWDSTTVSNGSHQFRARAHDTSGNKKFSGIRTITVNNSVAVNLAPTVNAGADQAILLPSVANLAGSVTDDGLPNPPGQTTASWSKISGPGTVTFSNATSVTTTASFSEAGGYTLRLTANDGALSASDDIAISVSSSTVGAGTVTIADVYRGSLRLTKSTTNLAQSFRAQGTALQSVTVNVASFLTGGPAIQVSLLKTRNGAPIATAEIKPTTQTRKNLTATFADKPALTPGTTYYLKFSVNGASMPSTGYYAISVDTNNPYPSGMAFSGNTGLEFQDMLLKLTFEGFTAPGGESASEIPPGTELRAHAPTDDLASIFFGIQEAFDRIRESLRNLP